MGECVFCALYLKKSYYSQRAWSGDSAQESLTYVISGSRFGVDYTVRDQTWEEPESWGELWQKSVFC